MAVSNGLRPCSAVRGTENSVIGSETVLLLVEAGTGTERQRDYEGYRNRAVTQRQAKIPNQNQRHSRTHSK
jgi:hypothetical protein